MQIVSFTLDRLFILLSIPMVYLDFGTTCSLVVPQHKTLELAIYLHLTKFSYADFCLNGK